MMEAKIASLIPARSVSRILAGKLQAQLLVHVTPQARNSQWYFEYDQAQNNNNKNNPPYNKRTKRLLLKASSYLSKGHSNVTSCEDKDSQLIQNYTKTSFNMKIAKKKVRM